MPCVVECIFKEAKNQLYTDYRYRIPERKTKIEIPQAIRTCTCTLAKKNAIFKWSKVVLN